MATEENVPQWDDQTDVFISAMEDEIQKDVQVSLRDMLENPESFSSKKGALDKATQVKSLVEEYFQGLLEDMNDEQKSLDQYLESIDSQYKRIDEVVASKTASYKIPYMKPFALNMNQDQTEEIVIDQYNDRIDTLVGKLVSISNYVADVSGNYKGHMIGSWIFSGQKPYMLSLNPPDSFIITIEQAQKAISDMVDDVINMSKVNQPAASAQASGAKPQTGQK